MIYCVEDDAGIRELVVYTLRNTGFEADGFEDGAALTAALKKCKPQLILLDIMLPGEDGITILRRLRATRIRRRFRHSADCEKHGVRQGSRSGHRCG